MAVVFTVIDETVRFVVAVVVVEPNVQHSSAAAAAASVVIAVAAIDKNVRVEISNSSSN